MRQWILVFLKGMAMGAANVIPGVSGGTVAFITGIYERLINALKSIDGKLLKLLVRGKLKQFSQRMDLLFLLCLGGGVLSSILTLAQVLKYCFAYYSVYVWAFFFGLIFASIYYVGKKVKRWNGAPVVAILFGAGVALGMAFLKPGTEDSSFFWLVICGMIAMASMIMPGLSGSFVLLLLGNYQLVMIESVSRLANGDLAAACRVLLPVGIGAVVGLLALSHFLSWIFRSFHDVAVALLTGFVAGSLLIIWPWKQEIKMTLEALGKVKEKTVGYEWFWPSSNGETFLAIGLMVLGGLIVWAMERFASKENSV